MTESKTIKFCADEIRRSIIVVTGLPRSGTSLMMRMLQAGGIELLTDGLRSADEDNPRGYFEFEQVKKLPEGDISWLPQAQGKAVKIIAALLPYLPDEFSYDLIFMQRDIYEVIASQRKMLLHRNEDPDALGMDDLIRLYRKHLYRISKWIGEHPEHRAIVIDYNNLMNDPNFLIFGIANFLNINLDLDRMKRVIDPTLYRQRS